MRLTGAQALIKSLEIAGRRGHLRAARGAILPVYDPILDSTIRHILVRHEQGAGHMAEGYAHVTGRPGVAMVTSGPGATNIVTPLADAAMDSIPLVVITGQVPTTSIGTDAFQECPITGVTMDITKHNWLVTDAQDIPRIVAEALPRGHHRATRDRSWSTSRRTSSNSQMDWYWPELGGRARLARLPAADPGRPRSGRAAAELVIAEPSARCSTPEAASSKPGRPRCCARFAERTGIPVVTTLMARALSPTRTRCAWVCRACTATTPL